MVELVYHFNLPRTTHAATNLHSEGDLATWSDSEQTVAIVRKLFNVLLQLLITSLQFQKCHNFPRDDSPTRTNWAVFWVLRCWCRRWVACHGGQVRIVADLHTTSMPQREISARGAIAK